MKNKKVLLTYHGACVDGTAAAAVAKMALDGRSAALKIIPIKSERDEKEKEELLNSAKENDIVFLLDNSFYAEELSENAPELIIIDHHISEKERIEKLLAERENVKYFFDEKKSGASLAWDYFFPNEKMPRFIWHVEDGDIWRMQEKENTDKVKSYASIFMNDIDKYVEFIKSDIEKLYEKGEITLAYSNMLADYYIRNAQALHLRLGEYKIKAYNVASIRPIVSEVGNRISKEVKEPVALFKVFGRSVNISFRSASEDWKPLPIELARMLGGGGHKLAAGASMPIEDFIKALEY